MHDHPQLRDARWVDDLTSLCLDSLVEPFLSHSVGPIFSDVVMILVCSYLRCIDSLTVISMEYRSDLLYVPIETFSSYQDRSDALVAILGHIPPFSVMEMIVFSEICYSPHYSIEGCLFTLMLTVSMIFAEMSLQQSTTSRV